MKTTFTFTEKPELTPEDIVFWTERLPKLLVGRPVSLTIIYDDSYGRSPEIVDTNKVRNINCHEDGTYSIDVHKYGIYCDCIPYYISRNHVLYTLSYTVMGGVQCRVFKVEAPQGDENGLTREQRDAWWELWCDTVDKQPSYA